MDADSKRRTSSKPASKPSSYRLQHRISKPAFTAQPTRVVVAAKAKQFIGLCQSDTKYFRGECHIVGKNSITAASPSMLISWESMCAPTVKHGYGWILHSLSWHVWSGCCRPCPAVCVHPALTSPRAMRGRKPEKSRVQAGQLPAHRHQVPSTGRHQASLGPASPWQYGITQSLHT